MCIDTEGNLYLAAGLNQPRGSSETLDTKAGIHIYSPAGKLLEFIPIPEDTITNCGFGGPDMKTVFVTAGKTLFRFRANVAGNAAGKRYVKVGLKSLKAPGGAYGSFT